MGMPLGYVGCAVCGHQNFIPTAVIEGALTVFTANMAVHIATKNSIPHPAIGIPIPHPVIALPSSSTVTVESMKPIRQTDLALCTSFLLMGNSTVIVG